MIILEWRLGVPPFKETPKSSIDWTPAKMMQQFPVSSFVQWGPAEFFPKKSLAFLMWHRPFWRIFSDSNLCSRYHASSWRLNQPPLKNMRTSNWIISEGIGMKIPKNIWETPPPRLVWDPRLQFFVVLQDSGQKLSPGLGQETQETQETQNTSAFI